MGGEFFRIKHLNCTFTFEEVIKEGMEALGFPDGKISSQCYDYQNEGYNWLITPPQHTLDLSSKENMSDGNNPAFLCFCLFFALTVCGLVSHWLGYFSSLQLKSKLRLTVKPLRLVVAEANVFILVLTSVSEDTTSPLPQKNVNVQCL